MVLKQELANENKGEMLRYSAEQIKNAITFDELEKSVKNEVEFLQNAAELNSFEANDGLIKNAVRRYESIWLPLLNSTSNKSSIVPPIDVHIVWRAHMLSPHQYRRVCLDRFGRVLDHQVPKATDFFFDEKSKQIWNAFCPEEAYEWNGSCQTQLQEEEKEQKGDCNAMLVRGTKQQIEFIKKASMLPNLLESTFVPKVIDGYIKFLQLAATYPEENLTPTTSVDLVWHTHQMCPMNYAKDCTKIFGGILMHDNGMETSKLVAGNNVTKALWLAHFQEEFKDEEQPPCGTANVRAPPCGTAGKVPPCGTAGLPPCGTAGKVPPCGTAGKMPPCGTAGKVPPCGTAGKVPPCGTAGHVPPCGTAGLPPCGTAGLPPCGTAGKVPPCGTAGLPPCGTAGHVPPCGTAGKVPPCGTAGCA